MDENLILLDHQYVLFTLEKEYYGIDILNVQTIERVTEITRVPQAPEHVEGVINLRGEIIPVINLRTRLNLSRKEIDEDSRIIIVSKDEIITGILVDSSYEVLKLEDDSIENAPDIYNSVDKNYIEAIGKNDDRIIILLNLKKVIETYKEI
ncbi:chemotaxis protein CheW [Lutibacter sp. B2]|nr:chemotaxis protein CheW [Lutibacter sp. B2]